MQSKHLRESSCIEDNPFSRGLGQLCTVSTVQLRLQQHPCSIQKALAVGPPMLLQQAHMEAGQKPLLLHRPQKGWQLGWPAFPLHTVL